LDLTGRRRWTPAATPTPTVRAPSRRGGVPAGARVPVAHSHPRNLLLSEPGAIGILRFLMKKLLSLFALVLAAAAVVSPASANQPAHHNTEDVTGDEIVCGYTDFFTILSSGGGVVGTVRAVFHMSPNGNIVDLNFGTCQLPEEE
jgi:hypothetical protein